MKNNISKNEKKARLDHIIEKIREGYSRKSLVDWVMETYGLQYKNAWANVDQSYKMLADTNNEELIESARAVQLERAEAILKDSLEHGDRKSALKALEILNKLNSLYVEKREIDVKSTDLIFKLE